MTIRIQRIIALVGLVLATMDSLGTARGHAQTTTKTQTFFVGTCKPGKADFITIQEAVTGVPADSIINVCPGTYPEQVTIQQSLTFQGITNGNNANVVITAPPGGIAPNNATQFLAAAQLAVMNASGTVNISNITVDGIFRKFLRELLRLRVAEIDAYLLHRGQHFGMNSLTRLRSR